MIEVNNMLEWMVTSSLLIVVLLGVRALCGRWMSQRLRYSLWLVVAVRLLIPFSLPMDSTPMPITAADLASEIPQVLERPRSLESTGVGSRAPAENLDISNVQANREGDVSADSSGLDFVSNPKNGDVNVHSEEWTLGDTLWAVWGAGVGLTALTFLTANLCFACRLKRRRRPLEAEDCPLPLYEAEGLDSPCLFGLFRPAIYLSPKVTEDKQMRVHVLAHERTHYAHGDHIWAVVRCLCLALHWYNPLVWLAAVLSKRDGELACDEGAVVWLGEGQRIPYGRTLVDLVVTERQRTDLLLWSTTMTEGKSSIRRRVEALVKHPKTGKSVLVAVVAIVALAVVFTFARERQPFTYAETLDYLTQASHVFTSHIDMSVSEINAVADNHGYAQALAELLSGGIESEAEDDRELYVDYASTYADGESALFTVDGPYWAYHLYLSEQANGCYLAFGWGNGGEVDDPLRRLAILPGGTVRRVVELAKDFAAQNVETLTEEELAWFNEEFFNVNFRNQFLTSTYSSPEYIDLYELFYQGGSVQPGASMSREEKQAVVDRDYDGIAPDVACTKITRAEMDRDLLEYTGLVLDQTNGNGLEKFTYLSEYDSYYVYHGDTNYYSQVTVISGERQVETVTLYYDDVLMDRGVCAITLREVEEGRYQFVSHLPVEKVTSMVSTLEVLKGLGPEQISGCYRRTGSVDSVPDPDPEQLTELIHRAADQQVEREYEWVEHGIWRFTLLYTLKPDDQPYADTGNNELILSAGTEEDVVCFYDSRERGEGYVFAQSPELYAMVRSLYIQPEEAVVRSDLIPIQEEVDRILREELFDWNGQWIQDGVESRYNGVELTEFRLLSAYPDLVEGAEVNFYAFNYGLTIADLSKAGWAGGNYADGNGLFHPYEHTLHLLTVERENGLKNKVDAWCIIPWEYRLEVGQPGFEDTMDRQEILDVVLNHLRGLLDPVVPAGITDPRHAAEEYGKALAQYYLSLGSGHPNAVTDAKLDGVEVYQRTEDGVCAVITLALDPVEPNSVYWMAGAGIEQGADGHWMDTGEYQLMKQEDGSWCCVDFGTGGVSLPEFS